MRTYVEFWDGPLDLKVANTQPERVGIFIHTLGKIPGEGTRDVVGKANLVDITSAELER